MVLGQEECTVQEERRLVDRWGETLDTMLIRDLRTETETSRTRMAMDRVHHRVDIARIRSRTSQGTTGKCHVYPRSRLRFHPGLS